MTTSIGYARVSRDDQNPALQIDALKSHGCKRIFSDYSSCAKFTRKGLTRALKSLSPGDELVVWKLDRFVRCLTQSFDTRTAIGRGVLAMVAAVAEDELERIRERTKAGMKAAKRRGAKIGRPRKLSPAEVRRAKHLIESGSRSRVSVAAGLGVHVGTLRRAKPDQAMTAKRRFRKSAVGSAP